MSEKKNSKTQKTRADEPLASVSLRSDVKALPLPSGLYLFSIKSATPAVAPHAGNLQFPALHVAPGPGCPSDTVDFVGLPKSIGAWLYKPGDRLVVKLEEPGATLILSSIRTEGTQLLDVTIERLIGNRSGVATGSTVLPTATGPGTSAEPASTTDTSSAAIASLKLQMGLHIRNHGDLVFAGSGWAGLLAENLWIEAISINLLETLTSSDVEYKGLSANGFETPWLSDGASCGTKGRGLPLIGFAIRLKSEASALYDCEYNGHFRSGASIGPLSNGKPCRSKTAGDPLVGIQLRIVKRAPAAAQIAPAPKTTIPVAAGKGPRFSKFREGGLEPDVKPEADKAQPAAKSAAENPKEKASPKKSSARGK